MDRLQMISKLEQVKSGNLVAFEENVSLCAKNGKVFRGGTEIPLATLYRYKNTFRVMIVEGEDPDLLQKIREDVSPELIITEIRNE
jgi:hypothetical protein